MLNFLCILPLKYNCKKWNFFSPLCEYLRENVMILRFSLFSCNAWSAQSNEDDCVLRERINNQYPEKLDPFVRRTSFRIGAPPRCLIRARTILYVRLCVRYTRAMDMYIYIYARRHHNPMHAVRVGVPFS